MEVIRMKRSIVTTFGLALLALGIVAYAQQRDREAPTQPDPQAQKVTLTGCLAKDGNAGQYSITDQQSHEKVSFPGPAQLDRFVDQVVKLTGSVMVRDNGDKIFRPESIASVAPSCAA
jgi:hypothetical protein